ncbi:hypothetical protein TMatcc_001923 [Talaromyces marneffei ATCC 18224]|uniref:Amidase, putative n=1 Tax=Talaromyces marneffei (strain ATCC 18224 / CBS 334.59 / QM 7333) TaxID=441960 RepID=B6QI65_TALMQ|nr:uncharacterized protein EYB26_006889 [Talaromyces marneffei]EEA23060.1 amidase, putative [Talaromyces marneffei ATCC 18224]KAE8551926.1 hypothetical protein EYB25_005817 [Talaromyces marneffei]QGA19201.1 hypothetical protein EYB26_006889 [Talaromyces marneffei]
MEKELRSTAASLGLSLPENEVNDYVTLLERMEKSLQTVLDMHDYQPTPDQIIYPRSDIHYPTSDTNPLGAWAWKFNAKSTEPKSDLLKGKTVCLKDNIAVAGVPCLLGTDTFQDWIPKTDATVVTRILDAGGIITGKAVCENLSRGAVSATAATGPVHNPYAPGYSAGGSSSGTAALVASGATDMGIGCDQGGSIRIPASLCGLYGFKPTAGLVPYTGIASNDACLDYVGPMTTTCLDNAILLEAIAGVDGLDDRQTAGAPFPKQVPNYAQLLEETKEDGIKGLKIGILKEGLDLPGINPRVEAKFQDAMNVFRRLGATVEDVHIPIHSQARTVIVVLSKMGNHMGMLGKATGRRQMMLTDLFEKKGLPYTPEVLSKMSVMSKEGLIAGEYAWKHYSTLYPKVVNLIRKLQDAYDKALGEYDVLVMPTTITESNTLPAADATPLEHMDASKGKLENTSPFNASGHPALAVPIGLVPSRENPTITMPTSMQIVGRYWDELTILKIAYAWEREVGNWKDF